MAIVCLLFGVADFMNSILSNSISFTFRQANFVYNELSYQFFVPHTQLMPPLMKSDFILLIGCVILI